MSRKFYTKAEESYMNSFTNACYSSVREAYANPSQAKLAIENEILSTMFCLGGHDYRVFSKNGFHFSCGFYVTIDGIHCLKIYTPKNWNICIPFEYVDEKTGEIIFREHRDR